MHNSTRFDVLSLIVPTPVVLVVAVRPCQSSGFFFVSVTIAIFRTVGNGWERLK